MVVKQTESAQESETYKQKIILQVYLALVVTVVIFNITGFSIISTQIKQHFSMVFSAIPAALFINSFLTMYNYNDWQH